MGKIHKKIPDLFLWFNSYHRNELYNLEYRMVECVVVLLRF